MYRFFAILFLFIVSDAVGQIINNGEAQAFTNQPFFNTEYIYKNKIKQIRGRLWVKAEGDKMRKRQKKRIYMFNKNGYITGRLTIDKSDTTAIYYKYDSKGRLLRISQSNRKGFASDYYNYNEKGKIKEIASFREQNASNSHMDYQPKNARKVSVETFQYRIDSSQNKVFITVYNKAKKPFKKITKTYNEHGYLLQEYTNYIVGSGFKNKVYKYNQKGLLSSIEITSKVTREKHYRYEFTYDEQQNIMSKKTIKNDKQRRKEEAVYDWENYTLKAFINNDLNLNFMKIYRLSFVYY